jgi:hypothetical protein
LYKTLIAQTLHYFSRPQERVLREPLDIPAAWKGSELRARDDWHETFTRADIDEIERAIALAKRTHKSLGALGKDDFPLPALSSRISRWRDEIRSGRGFQVLRGLPVTRWPESDAEIFFWCLGQHLGIPGAQNPQADLLGHVRDTGESPEEVRHYRTNVNINFHADAADVVGLLCLQEAKTGGLSRIVSSVAVYNEILRRRPDLIDRLYEPFMMDTKGEGGLQFLPVPPCQFDDGRLRTFYHTDYFRSASGYAGESLLSDADRAVLDLYNEIADSPDFHLDMRLRPGDIQLLSNHTVLHARTDYEDHPEPGRKRHLLRLWISLPAPVSLSSRLRKERSRVRLLATVVGSKVQYRLRAARR